MPSAVYEENGRRIIRLSNSSRKEWQDCPTKFYFRRIEGLVPKTRVYVFDVGSLGHVGCATYLHPSNQQFDQTARYKMARETIKSYYERELKPKGADKNALDEALHVFPVILRRRLRVRPITVEQWWEHRIDCSEFIIEIVGKVDALSILESDGSYYIEEHKFVSASGFGDKKEEEYQRSPQTAGYVVLAEANIKGDRKVRGVVHNFFLKKKEPDLKQPISIVGARDIARWNNHIRDIAHEINDAYEEGGGYKEGLDACRTWSGPCPYSRLCEFNDNPEIRRELYDIHEPKDKFKTLEGTAQREVPASDVPTETVQPESGVEKGLD